MDIRISVRNLVEFILRSGDLDNRRTAGASQAMLEGGKIHRMIQKRMGEGYLAEVALKHSYDTGQYQIVVEGRADGIFWQDGVAMIDEIKGTYRELSKINEPVPVHLAQAKCYAYMYGFRQMLSQVGVRMTYCNLDTQDIRIFESVYSFEELEDWFIEVLMKYQKWADYQREWNEIRQKSIKELSFPFPYREGQRQLVTYVYQTIYHKRKLFLEAPTGVGKTISTVFPAIKAIGEDKADTCFYLTAKTITRTVAEQTFQILRDHGLSFKSITLTAKDKICPMEEVTCNPVNCPYAKGHFDRINDALYDCITHESYFDRQIIEEYAKRYEVCPFEMSLDLSLFADGIICDYNYAFDPHVYLKRFFGENITGRYLFLVDEAHNLVDRGREMYSASLKKEDFLARKKLVKKVSPKMEKQLESCNKILLSMKRECNRYQVLPSIAPFLNSLTRLHSTMEKYLEEHVDGEAHEEILDFYFQISHFLEMNELVDENYVMYSELDEQDDFYVHLFCVNPATNLKECLKRSVSTIFFSATLLPVHYYKRLLGGEKEDYEVYAKSHFSEEKRELMIAKDVTSRYSRRTEAEYDKMTTIIYSVVMQKRGNYIVFCPSYSMMDRIMKQCRERFEHEQIQIVGQSNHMTETEKEDFLKQFAQVDNLVGFCVLGGIFSEGIDLKNEQLIGAFIVGTGLPQICPQRDLIKDFFDQDGQNGYDYAYRFPGMNKVLQAAGRVIRTTEDEGVVVLMDDRFLEDSYQILFPREWNHYQIVDQYCASSCAENFWKKRTKRGNNSCNESER